MTRSEARARFDHGVRLELVETDVDTLEAAVKQQNDALNGIRRVLVGVLVSVTTASVLLALNVLVMRGP